MNQTETQVAKQVLIETYWNVKTKEVQTAMNQLGINRNILECKVRISFFNGITSHLGINRNILECKGSRRDRRRFGWTTVLIETYWNVKRKNTGNVIVIDDVLIETYWNVKFIDGFKNAFGIRINRNILECKEVYARPSAWGICVLIETYWNVKAFHRQLKQLFPLY